MAKGEKNRLVGNIEWRGPGKCRLTVSGGFDPSGKRIRKRRTVTAKNDREAEKQLAAFIAELEGGSFADPTKMKLKDFAAKWLDEYVRPNLAPKVTHNYEQILNLHVIPALGAARLDQVKPLHIVEYENNLRRDGARLDGKPGGLADSSIMKHHRILSSMFNTAVQWQILKESPVARVKPPKVNKKVAPAYNEEQVATMLATLDSEPLKWRVLVHLALASGCRKSELMALTWDDIDWAAGTIEITKSRQYCPEEGVHERDCTKNETSTRLISLPLMTMNLLKNYKAEQETLEEKFGSLWKGSTRLFTTNRGEDMFPDTPTQWFSKFLKKHNLPELNFHGLRHTAATLLIHSGANVKAVSTRLGHAEISTTCNIYAKALRSADKACADAMENIFEDAQQRAEEMENNSGNNGPGGPKTGPKTNIIQFVNKNKARKSS
jgi:integrase